MKLQIQTLTGQIGEVEMDPQSTILDLRLVVDLGRGADVDAEGVESRSRSRPIKHT